MDALVYGLVPAVAAVLGALLALVRPPGRATRSLIQHFTAGLVFAAVAFELLADLPGGPPSASVLGVAVGIGAMLGIRALTRRFERGHVADGAPASGEEEPPAGLAAVAALDFLVDGLVIGIAFAHEQAQGLLLAGALGLEGGFLGLSVAVALQRSRARPLVVVGVTTLVSLPVVAGALVGSLVFGGADEWWTTAVLAFSAVALLYLVAEELLREAHLVEETPLTTAVFFGGFLVVLLFDQLLHR